MALTLAKAIMKRRGHPSRLSGFSIKKRRINHGARLGLNVAASAVQAFRNRRRVKSQSQLKSRKGYVYQTASKQFDGVYKTTVKHKGSRPAKWHRKYNATKNKSFAGANAVGQVIGAAGLQTTLSTGTFNTRSQIAGQIDSLRGTGLWKGYTNTQLYTNQSNAQIFMTAYFWKCRRSCEKDPLQFWKDLVTNKDTLGNERIFFAKPTDYKEWLHYYSLTRVVSVCLSPGAVWRFDQSHFPNFSVAPAIVQGSTQSQFIPNVSSGMFFTFHGPPLNDSSIGAEVGLGYSQKLDWVSSIKEFYYEYTINPEDTSWANTLPTAYTNTANVMLEDVDSTAQGVNA